jgi:lipoprotein
MKKSLALLALASLFIGTTSCRKKDEPKPVVPVLPNTTDNTADATTIKNSQAVFTVPAGSIVYISPKKGLNILGATMDKSDSTKFTVGSNGLIGINGNVPTLYIKSDNATEIALTKSSPLLKRLILITDARSASATATKVDLSGATELESLLVAGYTIASLDLTKQTKLKNLAIGAWSWGSNFPELAKVFGSPKEKGSSISEVKLPANNAIEYFALRSGSLEDGKLDVDNLPKLKKFFCQSPYFKNFTFAKSQDLEILFANSPTANIFLNVDLGNKPKLQDITLYNATLSKFAVSNATAANLLKDSSAPAEVVELDNIDPAQAVSYIKRTAGTITKSITLKNMSLTEAQILDLISGLGATNGTLKVKSELLTTAVNAALSAKGWTGTAL